jgi:hypothetical protein
MSTLARTERELRTIDRATELVDPSFVLRVACCVLRCVLRAWARCSLLAAVNPGVDKNVTVAATAVLQLLRSPE